MTAAQRRLAGLLAGRRATIHWALAEMLAAAHPTIDVDADHIYLHDGVWSSAEPAGTTSS